MNSLSFRHLRINAICLFWLMYLTLVNGSAQTQVPFNKIKESYEDGEGFFRAEDYKEALYHFLLVEQNGYCNANLQYKIGTCYLNISGQETKAIPYLEEAVKHISLKYKPKAIEEKKAPLHSWYYLGNAYRIDNQLDKALAAYDKFINNPGYEGTYNLDIVENEVKACERAKIIQDAAITVTWKNLGMPLNSSSSETNPVIAGDETVLAYLTKLKFYNAVYITRKEGNTWLPPENINSQILSDGDFYPTALSFNGKELYLTKKRPGNNDIYVSIYENGKWGVAKPLNKNINSTSDETYATITSDGKVLYFASNRSGGRGGFDLYYATRGTDNDWNKAENMGKIVNTKEDEITPSIFTDGKTLYFSSKGHFNMGGFDIFYTTLQKDGKWITPLNLGYPINTTNDNLGFQILGDGIKGLISRITADGAGMEDIYQVDIHSKFIQKANADK